MYFGIVGDNSAIVIEGLSYLHPTDIAQPRKNIITFHTEHPERLATCAVLIKRGTIVSNKELSDRDDIQSDIGVETKDLGSHLKKQIPAIKRFKLVEIIHTDLEIKDHGTEIINIDNTNYGIVEGYQNIALYEAIDFGKPVGGMNIGMMPSKLALTLINIGIGEYEKYTTTNSQSQKTIWDPFCGFGTTNFLVNALGYNTIASDINVTSMKQNSKRRPTQSFYDKNGKELILKQDVTQEFKSPGFRHADIIVSEGYLGHIVTSRTAPAEIHRYAAEVKTLYTSFAKNLTIIARSEISPLGGRNEAIHKSNVTLTKKGSSQSRKSLIITIPVRLKYDISVSQDIMDEFTSLGWTARLITQPYSREKQLVGRQILIASFGS